VRGGAPPRLDGASPRPSAPGASLTPVSVETALTLLTEREREVYRVLVDEGLPRAEAFCATRALVRRVLGPLVAELTAAPSRPPEPCLV
jgi:hypothetical protein